MSIEDYGFGDSMTVGEANTNNTFHTGYYGPIWSIPTTIVLNP